MTLIVLVATFVVLFGLAFLTKRRYGVLGLGLTAGFVLSEQVSSQVAALLRYFDVPTEPFTMINAARLLLVILPCLLLMLAGPKYTDRRRAFIGAGGFAIFGTFLLLTPLLATFPSADESLNQYLGQVAFNSSLITALAVSFAVFDLMGLHRTNPADKKSKH